MNLSNFARLVPLYLGTAVTGISIVISIPVMIQASGLDAWAQIGVGQSIGGVAAAFVSYGWGITGPAEIARLKAPERRREYAESLKARLLVAPFALFGGGLLTWSVTGSEGLALGLVGLVSTTLIGLNAAFFFLGTGELWKCFFYDSLPRSAATFVGIGLVALPGPAVPAYVIPILTSVGILAATTISGHVIFGGWYDKEPLPRAGVRQVLIARRHGLTTSVTTGAFQVLPTLIVGWFAPSSLPTYVFYDKLYKQAMTFLSPVFNVLQGWVPRADAADVPRRLKWALRAGVVGGLVSVLATVTAGWRLVDLLSSAEVQPDGWSLLWLGLMIGMSAADLVVSRVGLVVKHRMTSLAWASTSGFIVGSILVAVLAPVLGTHGALFATAVGIAVRLTIATYAFSRT